MIWDPHLTARDRELLAAAWAKPAPFGLGRRPAVLVIDDFVATLGERRLPLLEAIEEWFTSCGEDGWVAVERTRALLEVARATGTPIVYSTNDSSGPPWAIADSRLRGSLPDDAWARRHDIVDLVAPQPGDVVIAKTSASAFFLTPLITYLRHWDVDTVLVCGNATSGCVRATVVDASSYRFRVGVVEDCCFDRFEASHALNLFDMHHKYADVMSADDAEFYLRRSVGT